MPGKGYLVGLTGGIGSGKSAAAELFERRGIRVIDADNVAREVVEPGSAALEKIAAHFGPEILTTGGALDRPQLRDIIFTNPDAKKWLEALLHPLINQRIRDQLTSADSPYAILVSPLLLETAQHKLVDRVVVIDCPEQAQIARASARDGSDAEQIKAIMATQMDRQTRLAKADDILHNHGPLHTLEHQVDALHQRYLTQSQGPDHE